MDLEESPFLLRSMIGQTLRTLSARATQKGLEMVFDVGQNVPDALIGDPGRLRQILINLAGNAVKFTEVGDISIIISLVDESEKDVMLRFDVRDKGIGITPEQQSRIFEAFEQGDASTTKQFGGTGLGLAISKRLVTMMEGAISVSSTPGEGACFSFTSRFKLQEENIGDIRQSEGLENISVLVIDDNAINRQMLKGFLSRWKMLIHLASDAAEALEILNKMLAAGTLPRILLTDVHMPGMDGWELSAKLRQQKEYDNLRILIMPSAGMRGDARRCRELRIEGYLTKPVIMDELRDAMVAIVSGKQQSSELVTRHSVREEHYRCTILVVDDVEINRELLRATLEKQGHRIVMAENGREAVDQFSNGVFDIIFMDMQMPILDGYGAVNEIRKIEQEKNLERLPIVAMTAYAMQGDMEKCLAAGTDDYLSKPARPVEILAMLDKLVRKSANARPPDTENILNVTASSPVVPENLDDLPVFDRDELLERLGGRDEMLGRFIEMFDRNVAGYMEALDAAIERGDTEQVRIQSHTIKGASANISARRMRETAAAMEIHAREGRLDDAAVLLQKLKDDLKVFSEAVAA